MNKLIEALEAKKRPRSSHESELINLTIDECIDLITTLSETHVVVPKEPTTEMQISGADASGIKTTVINKLWTVNKIYKAMISSAEVE